MFKRHQCSFVPITAQEKNSSIEYINNRAEVIIWDEVWSMAKCPTCGNTVRVEVIDRKLDRSMTYNDFVKIGSLWYRTR